MSASIDWAAVFFAAAGGFLINVLRWIEHERIPKLQRPPTFSDPVYWLQFVSLPLLGGFFALAYSASGVKLSPILAVNIGASAPLILRTMAASAPTQTPDKVG
jgi:hypothetical protein